MEWSAMTLLGAYHGINPAMGWLFAVALGMQQGSARALWRAFPPLVLGHALAVGSVLAVAAMARLVVPLDVLRLLVAGTLVAIGSYSFWRHRHPRFGGMQVGFRDLTVWSFLMASAHGAGVMLLPFVMTLSADVSAASDGHAAHTSFGDHPGTVWTGTAALGVHTGAYLLVAALVAWVVYRKVGLRLLRTAWFNVDWLWAGALVLAGVVVALG